MNEIICFQAVGPEDNSCTLKNKLKEISFENIDSNNIKCIPSLEGKLNYRCDVNIAHRRNL